jgi:hypothetical protein
MLNYKQKESKTWKERKISDVRKFDEKQTKRNLISEDEE